MNDSGELRDTESNHSGKISHVPSQPTVVPSPRSMLSREKRLRFPIQASQKYDHSLKPLSKRTQIILCSTRTSSSRKEWSSTLAPIDAMSG